MSAPYQPVGPGYPPPIPPRAPTGALAWGLGLLVLVCVPFVTSVVVSAVMIGVGRAQRRHGPPAAEVGRQAANWGLTYLLATVVLVPLHFILLFVLTRDGPVAGFFPLGIPITAWGLVTVAHVVICLIGLVRSSGGRTFRPPAIGFFRS